MISEVRLIGFLFNGCLVANQPQSVLQMFLNFYISNTGTTQKCPYILTVEKSVTVQTSVQYSIHSRPQRPRSFWSAPRIATSGQVQHRKSAIHGLPVTLRMFRIKFDKSDWSWSQCIVLTKPFRNGMPLDKARGRDSWCWPKGARPLGTRMYSIQKYDYLTADRVTTANIKSLVFFM